ncbi:MAG: type II toxin-antitoxin system VapC family toxin [Pseudomonadota bacterium]
MIVLDASVFAKLFVSETDSETAKALVQAIQTSSVSVLLPSLFTYEIVQIGRYHGVEVDMVLNFLESQLVSNWNVIEPTRTHWGTAQAICEAGHTQSGFPAMYDAVYHALAIEGQGAFVTADKKHYMKARQFGAIHLLQDWADALE